MTISVLDVKEAWQRVDAWYRANVSDESGWIIKCLWPAPATESEISAIEEEFKVRFPPSLRGSYLLFNGDGGFRVFDYGYWLSLDQMRTNMKIWLNVIDQGYGLEPQSINCSSAIRKKNWVNGWLPITDSGSGDHYVVDMNPTKKGTVGQVFRFSHETGPKEVVAPSFEILLSTLVHDLEGGRYRWSDEACQIVAVQ